MCLKKERHLTVRTEGNQVKTEEKSPQNLSHYEQEVAAGCISESFPEIGKHFCYIPFVQSHCQS